MAYKRWDGGRVSGSARRGRGYEPSDPRGWGGIFQLIGLNVAVFVLWHVLSMGFMYDHFTLSWDGVFRHPWTLLTYAFSQRDMGHLFGNLLGIYFFGRGIEETFGRKAIWKLYVAGALIAAVANLLIFSSAPTLGASGSVMALGAAYATLWPNRTFLINFLIPVPAWALMALYAAADLTGALGGGGTGIAHMAHLGGLAYGLFWAFPRRKGGRGRGGGGRHLSLR